MFVYRVYAVINRSTGEHATQVDSPFQPEGGQWQRIGDGSNNKAAVTRDTAERASPTRRDSRCQRESRNKCRCCMCSMDGDCGGCGARVWQQCLAAVVNWQCNARRNKFSNIMSTQNSLTFSNCTFVIWQKTPTHRHAHTQRNTHTHILYTPCECSAQRAEQQFWGTIRVNWKLGYTFRC